jgi:hypothetical protein
MFEDLGPEADERERDAAARPAAGTSRVQSAGPGENMVRLLLLVETMRGGPGEGLQSWRGESAGVAKRPRE